MSIVAKPHAAASDDRPLDTFSHCHAGIVQQLHALGELPALLAPAERARRIAAETLAFFRPVVHEHHAEEERELFPAVLASAMPGEERDRVRVMVDQLVAEHRRVEAAWDTLEPDLKDVARGRDTRLDADALQRLVALYLGHASFEEREFLPLCAEILSRDGNHMAALGMSLHMRHAMPDAMRRYGHRI